MTDKDHTITPLQVTVLMAAYSGTPLPLTADNETWQQQIGCLVEEELLEAEVGGMGAHDIPRLTERGRVLVEHMLSLPFPVTMPRWVMPE